MEKNPKIVIIGAGAAGLAAAVRLKQKCFDNIVILEAEDHLGGRINSIKFGDSYVDLGAQWCHGQENNIVYELVNDLDLLAPSYNTYTDHIFCQDGNKLAKKTFDILLNVAHDVLRSGDVYRNQDKSFGDSFEEIFRYKLEQDPKRHVVMSYVDDFISWFHSFLLCYKAAPNWFDISVTNKEYEKCPGYPLLHWKGKGFNIFLDVLLKKYHSDSEGFDIENNIQYNKEVCCIHYAGTNEENDVEIHCTDKSVFKADHVICTIPLGSLKKYHNTLFDPKLPDIKVNAIVGLGFGSVCKIFLKFPRQWWSGETKGFSLLWNNAIRQRVRREYPQYIGKDGKSWMEGIFGFYVIDENPCVLLGWLTGPGAVEIEKLASEQVMDACLYILEQFVGCTCKVPSPQCAIVSKWNTNPNFLGTWSYRSMDTQKLQTCALHLAEPIKKRHKNILLFAGEATHPYYFSTVHGAVESGFREADRIASTYSVEPKRKIIIVGGGIAGISAALTLLNHGVQDFVILEADKNLGGRIKTIYHEGKPLEMGAQWIHGSGNTIYQIAKNHNLILPEQSHEGTGVYVRNDGCIFDEDLVKWVDFRVGKILEECEHFTDTLEHPKSVGHYLKSRFSENLKDIDENCDKGKYLDLLDWHLRFQNIDNSCDDLQFVSAKEWGKYYCPDLNGQEHINLMNGYQSLIDVLVKKIDPTKIHLQTTVEKIKWKDNNNSVTVTSTTGKTYCCDHVLVTCSLGVLKRDHATMFDPPLPFNMRSSIDAMGFDSLGKVYLVFEKKWWDVEGFQLIWTKDAVMEGLKGWVKHISGMDSVYNHPNVLVVWVGGRGVALMESLPAELLGTHCVDLLRVFLKKRDIPYPIKVIRSCWLSNRRVGGGYSYSTPENDDSNKDRSQLLKAALEGDIPRILLAGEAVHLTYFSTVHGAFESGRSQTEKLLNYLKAYNNVCPKQINI
ncbi:spermine oxidase-like isoform X1 [Agrilus planipennis]|uniref:Spermine oxidase-like isoform X1 n=1 Tax=Agrilus planipennis TaxID=224129 RepID=A0A1W4X6W3_AGRPL|nr:spermine oxidase-like isoform X1 [Agrilus planipennis]